MLLHLFFTRTFVDLFEEKQLFVGAQFVLQSNDRLHLGKLERRLSRFTISRQFDDFFNAKSFVVVINMLKGPTLTVLGINIVASGKEFPAKVIRP